MKRQDPAFLSSAIPEGPVLAAASLYTEMHTAGTPRRHAAGSPWTLNR